MNLLENELVKKYFGCVPMQGCCAGLLGRGNPIEHMAFRILESMQQPIKKGERYIHIASHGALDQNGTIVSDVLIADSEYTGFHGSYIRLPDRFQPKQKCSCTPRADLGHTIDGVCDCVCHKPKDEVEEKIRALADALAAQTSGSPIDRFVNIADELRELVALARKT